MAAVAAEAPARQLDTHVQDRFVSSGDRERTGWRNLVWPIQQAYEAKPCRLASNHDTKHHHARSRWLAIVDYAEIKATALERSGRDSSDMDIVTGGAGWPISEGMNTAIKKLVSIDSHMSQRDRKIVRLLCDGHELAYAVQQACGDDFKFTVRARVRDALDALIDALEEAKKSDFRYVRMVP